MIGTAGSPATHFQRLAQSDFNKFWAWHLEVPTCDTVECLHHIYLYIYILIDLDTDIDIDNDIDIDRYRYR